jgi:hypothetical protein
LPEYFGFVVDNWTLGQVLPEYFGCVVDNWTLGQVSTEYFGFFSMTTITITDNYNSEHHYQVKETKDNSSVHCPFGEEYFVFYFAIQTFKY